MPNHFQKCKLLIPMILGMTMLPGVTCYGQSAVDSITDWRPGITLEANMSKRLLSSEKSHSRTRIRSRLDLSFFYLGESFVQSKNYVRGYSSFQTFLTRAPNHSFAPRAKFRMGECAYRQGHHDQASRLLEAFSRTHRDDPLLEFALTYLGDVRLERNEPQLAQRAYEDSLQVFPHGQLSNQSRFGLARALQIQGETAEAIRFYKFLKRQGNHQYYGEACFQLGRIAVEHQRWDHGIENFELAIPGIQGRDKLIDATYWMARCYMGKGSFDKALELFRTIESESTQKEVRTAVLFDGAIAAVKAGQDRTAERWLSELLDRWPNGKWSEQALQMKIEIAFRSGDMKSTMQLVSRFIEQYSESRFLPQVLDFSGRVAYSRRDYAAAIDTFQTLTATYRDSSSQYVRENLNTWHYFLALSLVGEDRPGQADVVFEKIDRDQLESPAQPSFDLARATTLLKLDRAKRAIPYFESYLETKPTATDVLSAKCDLVYALAAEKQWKKADSVIQDIAEDDQTETVLETILLAALRANENDQSRYASNWFSILADSNGRIEIRARALSGLGWIHMERSDVESANRFFQRLIDECPTSPFLAEAALAIGKSHESERRYRQANEYFGLVVQNSNHPNNRHLKNIARLRQSANLQKIGGEPNLILARDRLIDFLQESTDSKLHDEAIYLLAWVYRDLKKQDQSEKEFAKINQDFPNSRFWADSTYRIADSHFRSSRFEECQRLVTQLLQRDINPQVMSRCLYLQGRMAAQKKNWKQVQEVMERLVGITRDRVLYAKANYWLAEAYFQQNGFAAAEKIFTQLCDKPGLVDPTMRPWIFLRQSQSLCHLEKWNPAMKVARSGQSGFSDFPSNYEFDFVIGRALEGLGRFDDARRRYEKVITSTNGSGTETAAMAQWRIGEGFFHQKKYRQAIAAYYRVDSLYAYENWRAAALVQAGKCQEHLGNWKHAIKLYRQLISEFPESQYRADAEKRMKYATNQASADVGNKRR